MARTARSRQFAMGLALLAGVLAPRALTAEEPVPAAVATDEATAETLRELEEAWHRRGDYDLAWDVVERREGVDQEIGSFEMRRIGPAIDVLLCVRSHEILTFYRPRSLCVGVRGSSVWLLDATSSVLAHERACRAWERWREPLQARLPPPALHVKPTLEFHASDEGDATFTATARIDLGGQGAPAWIDACRTHTLRVQPAVDPDHVVLAGSGQSIRIERQGGAFVSWQIEDDATGRTASLVRRSPRRTLADWEAKRLNALAEAMAAPRAEGVFMAGTLERSVTELLRAAVRHVDAPGTVPHLIPALSDVLGPLCECSFAIRAVHPAAGASAGDRTLAAPEDVRALIVQLGREAGMSEAGTALFARDLVAALASKGPPTDVAVDSGAQR